MRKAMCVTLALVGFVLLPVGLAAQVAESRGAQTDPAKIARTALDATLAADYDAFAPLADDTVRAALTRERFAAIAPQLAFQFGELGGVAGFERSARQGAEIFVFAVDYERATVKLMVAVDAAGRVAGLRMVGADPKAFWQPPAYADPSSFGEEEVTVGAEGFPLPGTLTLPKKEGRLPAVVLVHGSGPNDRDETVGPNKVFKDLAWGMASRGIAVLRYEKRTKAFAASYDVATANLENEVVDDAIAAVAFLRTRPEIDPARIFVLGHSLGGFAAPFIARIDSALAGIVVVEGTGQPILDILARQIEYLARQADKWNDEAQAQVASIREIARRGRAGEDVADETILGIPARYWLDLDRRDAPAVAAGLDLPVLVVQGGRDYQTTRASFERWKAALAGRPAASFAFFDDLNHLLMSGEGPSTPQEYQQAGHVDERVLDAIVDWIDARVETDQPR